MKTRAGWLIVLIVVLSSVGMAFQATARTGENATLPARQHAEPFAAVVGGIPETIRGDLAITLHATSFADVDAQDDPSYKLYKEGYQLILDENWTEARSKFKELISKYAKSKYCADAQYWMAYSLKDSNKNKAIEAYKSFLKKYPSSNYYDDATADLGRLENPVLPVMPPPNRFAPPMISSGTPEPEVARVAAEYAVAAEAGQTYTSTSTGSAVSAATGDDPRLNMKVEAFQALLRSSHDDKAFELLKQTLLDPKQPYRMKETAIFGSKQFEQKDLVDLYLQALKTDTNTMVRRHLLYQLGTFAERGDGRILPVLTQTALDPKEDRQVREAALFGMRNMKSHEALDLYVRIARSDADRKFREIAVYQIGQTAKPDDEVAFRMLKDIVLDKNQSREIREAALYATRTFKGGKAADLCIEVAKSDPDERIQQLAVWHLGEVSKDQPERAFTVLKEIAQDRSRHWSIRETAMNQIMRSGSDEAFNLLISIAKTDPEERIRLAAISYIGHLGKNESKSLSALTSLFGSLPKEENSTLQNLLYAIASIGNDDAVDFLGKVAKTHENYEMRRAAVQYLGNIGGEKARTILVEIMNGK